MKGFGVLILLVFIVILLPLLALETWLVSKTSQIETDLIQNQQTINLQNDVIRTFSEVAKECKKSEDPELCKAYLAEWVSYWGSRGFEMESGELDFENGKARIIKKVRPFLSKNGGLKPSQNISRFGIVLKSKKTEIVINGGVWA